MTAPHAHFDIFVTGHLLYLMQRRYTLCVLGKGRGHDVSVTVESCAGISLAVPEAVASAGLRALLELCVLSFVSISVPERSAPRDSS